MKKSEQLFFLIKSLTKAEKRSFKLFAKINSKDGKSNYTLLFDAIDQMKEYDHKQLLSTLKGKTNTKNISTLKNQLTEVILRSLRQYSSEQSIEKTINQNLDYVAILFTKGLYNQASGLIDKTRKLAVENNDYIALDRLSMYEYNIAWKQPDNQTLNHFIQETYPEVKQARQINDMLAEFEVLSLKMRLLLLESNGLGGKLTKQRFDEIISHPLLRTELDSLPEKCQIDAHVIWGHYYFVLGDLDKTYEHRKKALELMEKINLSPRVWLSHARFLLVGLSTFRQFELFDKELNHINEYIGSIPKEKKSGYFESELQMTLFNIRLDKDIDQGNFTAVKSYQNEIERLLVEFDHFIDINLKMAFYSNLVTGSIANQEYRQGLRWANKILDDPEMRLIRIGSQCYTRIKNICIHFCLGNYELMDSLVVSTKRFFKNNDRNNDFALYFLQFASKHLHSPYSNDKQEVFEEAAIKLEVYRHADQKSQIAYEYFDAISWILSIARGISMEEATRQSVKSK